MRKLPLLVLGLALGMSCATPAAAHGRWHNHGGVVFYPGPALAGAVVGAAVAVATLPFAILDSAFRPAPYYAPPAYYAPPPAVYYAPPPAAWYPPPPAYYPAPYAPRVYYYGGWR